MTNPFGGNPLRLAAAMALTVATAPVWVPIFAAFFVLSYIDERDRGDEDLIAEEFGL